MDLSWDYFNYSLQRKIRKIRSWPQEQQFDCSGFQEKFNTPHWNQSSPVSESSTTKLCMLFPAHARTSRPGSYGHKPTPCQCP